MPAAKTNDRIVRPLWRCPSCGHQFVTKNLWHSCGRYTLAQHFKGKQKSLREAFRRFVQLARDCGPVTVYAQKSRIVLQCRVRFASAVVHRNWLEANLWLPRRIKHPMLHRTENLGRLGYGIHLRLQGPEDIDPAIALLMHEAYAIGQQKHRR